jgi:hypothetical protein
VLHSPLKRGNSKKLETFSKRDAWRALRGRFGRAADLDAPLAMLVEHGYLHEQEMPRRTGCGRKPSQVYLVYPLGQNGQNTLPAEGKSLDAPWPQSARNTLPDGQNPHA